MGFNAHRLVLPVLVLDVDPREPPHAVCGTGFLLGDGLFVTCWHCVRDTLPSGQRYATAYRDVRGIYQPLELSELAQDENGADIAIARVVTPYTTPERLELSTDGILLGTAVSTFGYPLSEKITDETGARLISLHPRALRGYITRLLHHEVRGFGRFLTYELDMPVPAGLSGAPLLADTVPAVLGIVQGTIDSYTIVELSSVDPDTGEQRPEVRRIHTFGAALSRETLYAAWSSATSEEPLERIAWPRIRQLKE